MTRPLTGVLARNGPVSWAGVLNNVVTAASRNSVLAIMMRTERGCYSGHPLGKVVQQ